LARSKRQGEWIVAQRCRRCQSNPIADPIAHLIANASSNFFELLELTDTTRFLPVLPLRRPEPTFH
jgi:hypothetical protein